MGSNGRRASRVARESWSAAAVGLATIIAWGTAVAQVTDPAEAAIRRGVDLRRVQADHDQRVATWTAAIGYGLGGQAM